MNLKKGLYISAVWLLPVVIVLLESFVFLPKANWHSVYVPYFITFWGLRAVIAPLIVYYTLRFWVEHNKILKLIFVQVIGFVLFSFIFWIASYLILHNILSRSEFFGINNTATNMQVFGMIVDNSASTNSIVYISTVVFCYVWEFIQRNVLINKRALALEKSLLTSRLELLKGQLNTHFLFNTLHTISSFVVRKQNDEANKMLVRLSDLLRFALKENTDQLITLEKEIELLQLYLDIQQTRFKDRLKVSVQCEPSILHCMVPSFILQPMVENAVKYGVEPYSETGRIEIDVHSKSGKLNITVKDNGKHEFSKINFDNGIGLSNTKERLKQLYGIDHLFTISPNRSGNGVKVSITIPFQTEMHAVENINS
ncbi:MAG: histidine kinase [Chitinophagaceae bacterium]|nr:histidine kinase [Chitinophagaceae bacterium]